MMNFRGLVGSELKPMLRRILLALLMVASSAAFLLPAAAQGAMHCDQVSVQAPTEGCGGDAMAGSTCTVACHGACITPSSIELHPDVKVVKPSARCSGLDSDGPRAPDTAPPKHFIA